MSDQLDGQQAGAQQGGALKDPLSVRNTDTGSMKRMAAEASTNQARKTIKLKPLAPKKGGVAPSDLTSPAMPAAPAAAPAESPVVNPSSVTSATPIDAGVSDQATVAMDRSSIDEQTRKLQKPQIPVAAVASSPSYSGAVPAHGLPGSKQTIKLRPSTGGTASAAPEATVVDQGQRPASAQTIKLTPKSAAPASAPTPSGMPAISLSAVPAPTTSTAAAIKDVQTVAMAKNTIRLVPKKAEVPSSAPVQPKPSDPTINLQSQPASSGIQPSAVTTKLAPTQMMPQPTASAEVPAAEVKTKIGIKHHVSAPPSPVAAPGEAGHQAAAADELEGGETDVAVKDEPNIIFTIAAAVAFLTIGFLSFVLFAQYDNHWWKGNVGVPGLHRLVK